ncbi:MAG: uracil-DNA glycosylase [Gammaproteobacteria bacterium]|nr:uracil-DNA glycosylase [Gammaproteobacteria bacterium]
MVESSIKLERDWLAQLEGEFSKSYMDELRRFLVEQKRQGKTVFPPGSEYFNALDSTPFGEVKVVIIGQDPYHGPGQAHGLCFSVRRGVQPPPSLVNIYKEIESDLGLEAGHFEHGCLQAWAEQGVLLLNAVLTVEKHKAGSHQGKGWEEFTGAAIRALSEEREHIVFMLWGSYAQKKGAVIDTGKHLVLKAPHPSPLSAHRGFFGCRHFSRCNDYLRAHGMEPVDWGRLDP